MCIAAALAAVVVAWQPTNCLVTSRSRRSYRGLVKCEIQEQVLNRQTTCARAQAMHARASHAHTHAHSHAHARDTRTPVPTPGRVSIPTPQEVSQLTLNRVRECAVKNKEDAMKLLCSPDSFTRRGQRRLRELIGQLIIANPVGQPTTSMLLQGTWDRQGGSSTP